MIQIIALIVVACLIGILAGQLSMRARTVGIIAGAALVYVVSLMAWWWAMYFQLVRFDELLAGYGIYRTGGILGGLIYLGPAMIPTALFLIFSACGVQAHCSHAERPKRVSAFHAWRSGSCGCEESRA